MYEKERASERGDDSREEDRTTGSPSFARKETTTRSRARAKEERGGKRRHEPGAREDGEFMEISPSQRETVMHVSPISVTKRLLATFCPRDNSLSFFIAAPISQLKNYNREVGTLWNVNRYWSLNIRRMRLYE